MPAKSRIGLWPVLAIGHVRSVGIPAGRHAPGETPNAMKAFVGSGLSPYSRAFTRLIVGAEEISGSRGFQPRTPAVDWNKDRSVKSSGRPRGAALLSRAEVKVPSTRSMAPEKTLVGRNAGFGSLFRKEVESPSAPELAWDICGPARAATFCCRTGTCVTDRVDRPEAYPT
jgi:hypothetical protein